MIWPWGQPPEPPDPEIETLDQELARLRAEQQEIAERLERLELELKVIRHDASC